MTSKARSTRSNPLLPASYVRAVESSPFMRNYPSSVYKHHAHTFRLRLRAWHKSVSPDKVIGGGSKSYTGFTVEARRSTLHYAAIDGDVLQVAELVYAGATVDFKDNAGITPLYLVLERINKLKSGPIIAKGVRGTVAMIARTAQVAQILIEQHADVNISVDNVPLLHLACRAGHWKLIELLLEHGASQFPSPACLFKSPADRFRFSNLLDSLGRFSSRPPRACPCFSGRRLMECHGKGPLPYPADYICVCGSGKTYKICCSVARGQSRVCEYWVPELNRIRYRYMMVGIPKEMEEFAELMLELEEVVPGFEAGLELDDDFQQSRIEEIDEWVDEQKMDAAFAYAFKRVDFFPRPQGRKISRMLSNAAQQTWNKLVDEYIAQGCDVRSQEDIERAAKVGSGNGALIRICEAPACGKVEKKDVKILQKCARCKIAVYCSRDCQISSWKTHKEVCCSEDQTEQWLPSQTFIVEQQNTVPQRLASDLREIQATMPPEVADLLRLHRLRLSE